MHYIQTTRDGDLGSGVTAGAMELERNLQVLSSALERERQARVAAEAESRRKSEKLAALAHDLRSPLNAILGWAQLLAIKCAGDPQIAAILPRIESSARAQIKILSELDAPSADKRASSPRS